MSPCIERTRLRWRRRGAAGLAAFGLALCTGWSATPAPLVHAGEHPAAVQGKGRSDEYAVKAAFLHNFVRYVTWPESAFKDRDEAFTICVLGKDPFGSVLDSTFAGSKVDGRRIAVKRRAEVADIGACHLLFVPRTAEHELARLRELYGALPVLVIAESTDAAERGAHMALYLEKSKMRFAVNLDATRRAQLEMSSELLKLARRVDTRALEQR
jgi:hypothetical protein